MGEYDDQTVAGLEEALTLLHGEIKALRAQKRAISKALDRHAIEAEAARKLAALSDPERAALRRLLAPEGIASEAAVGTPGS